MNTETKSSDIAKLNQKGTHSKIRANRLSHTQMPKAPTNQTQIVTV